MARSKALQSIWVKREVEVYLQSGKTPILININNTVQTAAVDAPLAQLALEKHWLRIEEQLPVCDADPTADCIDKLNRSFNATRQETIRIRFFQGAAAAFSMIAILALWQAWEALQAQSEAERQRDIALIGQSRFLADLANQQSEIHDYASAMLLALEGVPDNELGLDGQVLSDRPYLAEAAHALTKVLSQSSAEVGIRFIRAALVGIF